jgi:hypothetical protein
MGIEEEEPALLSSISSPPPPTTYPATSGLAPPDAQLDIPFLYLIAI